MKSDILGCPHNDIYFLESNENTKVTTVSNIFVSNAEKPISKYTTKRKLKNKFYPSLEFFAGTETKVSLECQSPNILPEGKNGRENRHINEKCTYTASSKTGSSLENTLNKMSRRKSLDMYEEAANELGLSCAQTDNCRCIDCQCHYFDYNDQIDFEDENDYLVDHASVCTIQ